MIQHIVMLNLKADHDPAELQAVMAGLAGLALPGFDGFSHGPNRDYEGKSPDYPYGFICSFADPDAVARYAGDPGHKALGARLVSLCDGGAAGIMVMDIETN